jgi:DNA repair exonuclease SbcCD ATPase subunit
LPNELINLTLTELSLVDVPANPLAVAPIFKAVTNTGEKMTKETKETQAEVEALAKAQADVEALKAENERLRKGLLDAGYVIKADAIEKKAAPEFIEYEGEKVNKSDIPQVILKRLEAMEVEKREADVAKKAEQTFPNLKTDLAVALVKADFAEELMSALAALDSMMGEQMEEIGKSNSVDGDMSNPTEKLNSLAKKYAEENATTFAKGYAAVVKTDAGKALIKETYSK